MTSIDATLEKERVPDKSSVQVIARAAAILRSLEDETSGLSLGQIAQRVGLARSTVQRIVAALETEQLLIAASPTGRVMLGPAILRLSASVRSDFVSQVRPLLIKTSADLHETVDLATVKKDRLVFVDQVIGPQRLRTVSSVGDHFPLTCTANGKAFLANLDDRAVERLVGSTFEGPTPNAITTIGPLLADLARIRKRGVAFDREEHSLGICAAGVALFDPLGNPLAISIPVPTHRFQENETVIAERLLETKQALQDLLAPLHR